MAKAKKKKYSASDKAILGIGYVLLGAFVLSILVPLLYVVIASFMDPNVLIVGAGNVGASTAF